MDSYIKVNKTDRHGNVTTHYRWNPEEPGTINEDGTAFNGNNAAPLIAISLIIFALFAVLTKLL